MKNAKSFVIVIMTASMLSFFSCNGYEEDDYSYKMASFTPNLPLQDSVMDLDFYRITFLPSTAHKIMMPNSNADEDRLSYYNVIEKDGEYTMVYSFTSRNAEKLLGNPNLAREIRKKSSPDGKTWTHLEPPRSIAGYSGLYHKRSSQEQFFFYDQHTDTYRIIFNELSYNHKWSCLMMSSQDGAIWENTTKLWEGICDTQYSVLTAQNKYYIYRRHFKSDKRCIALVIVDDKGNIIKDAQMVYESKDPNYPHVYNSAVCKVDENLTLCFPTFFNQTTDAINIRIGTVNNYYALNILPYDISHFLCPQEQLSLMQWILVSPNLIPAEEDNHYWLYFTCCPQIHSATKKNTFYARVKLIIEPL